MGNFEKLSVLVIVVIIVMILVVALYTWTDNPDGSSGDGKSVATAEQAKEPVLPPSPLVTKPEGNQTVAPLPPVTPRVTTKPAVSGKPDPRLETLMNSSVPPSTPPGTGGSNDLLAGPSPTPPPAEAKPAEPKTHVFQLGETVSKIAKVYYPGHVAKGTDAILKANPTLDPSRIRPGTKVTIPDLAAGAAPGATPMGSDTTPSPKPERAVAKSTDSASAVARGASYTVKRGDTLPNLSRRAYGDTNRWQDIWLENFSAIDDPDHLVPGTHLKIPR